MTAVKGVSVEHAGIIRTHHSAGAFDSIVAVDQGIVKGIRPLTLKAFGWR